jgi:DNA-nicking Smr family endonuclease
MSKDPEKPHLSARDQRLWDKITRSFSRPSPDTLLNKSSAKSQSADLSPDHLKEEFQSLLSGQPQQAEPSPHDPVSRSVASEKTVSLISSTSLRGHKPETSGPVLHARPDRRTRSRLARGHIPLEGRLDLHGMTQMQAYHQLSSFVRKAHQQGKTWVLVITGKGRGSLSPVDLKDHAILPFKKRGVLRKNLPQWLQHKELAPFVSQFCQAHQTHGGEGAWYIRLKRRTL